MVRICSIPCRAGGTAPADQLPMMTQLKIGRPTTVHRCHCEGASPWQSASPAMRSIARPPWGRKENGLPRRFAPRNDRGRRRLVLLFFLRRASVDLPAPLGRWDVGDAAPYGYFFDTMNSPARLPGQGCPACRKTPRHSEPVRTLAWESRK